MLCRILLRHVTEKYMHIHRIAAFTKDGQGGNPAGVVLLDNLPSRADMQAVASAVGYSETVFAAPRPGGSGSWIVRYFSPEVEVPFCGHATIALGAVLAQTHGAGRYPLSLAAAEIEVLSGEDNGNWWSVLRSPRTRSSRANALVLEKALELFGYNDDDLDPTIAACLAHAGTEHLIIPLQSREALARMTYELERGRDFMKDNSIGTVAFIFRKEERVFHARSAFATGGVLEDPATGAAAAAFAGMLRDLGILISGRIVIIQGEDMGQPSLIEVDFSAEFGSSVEVRGITASLDKAGPATP